MKTRDKLGPIVTATNSLKSSTVIKIAQGHGWTSNIKYNCKCINISYNNNMTKTKRKYKKQGMHENLGVTNLTFIILDMIATRSSMGCTHHALLLEPYHRLFNFEE